MEIVTGSYASFTMTHIANPRNVEIAGKGAGVPSNSVGSGSNADGAEPTPNRESGSAQRAGSKGGSSSDELVLSPEEQAEVEDLKKRDAEVRAHEQAHLAAAGPYARGGARYEYEQGPDRRRYAVGGEVPMDISSIPGSPQSTIEKMQIIKRAALAPAKPSSQDYAAAAKADMKANRARRELLKQQDASRKKPADSAQAAGSLIDVVV